MEYKFYGLFDPRNDIIWQNLYNYDWGKQLAYHLSNINIFGFNPINMYDNANYWADYMKNTGLSWTDVRYPSRMSGAGDIGRALSGGWMFSKNIISLYDD